MSKFSVIYLNDSESRYEQKIEDNTFYNAIPIDVSDGYHTMSELYNHRHTLFCALCKIYDNYITPFNTRVSCWKSKLHDDGTMFEDSFIAGMTVNKYEFNVNDIKKIEYITYHLPLSWWDKFKVIELKNAPPYDGHTSDDVLERLMKL